MIDLDALRSRVTLDDVLAAAGYDAPNRKGMIRCPFHGEKTASCKVYRDQHYHCYGCGTHGDVFTLAQKLHHVDFKESIAIVARLAGMDIGEAPHLDMGVANARKQARDAQADWHDRWRRTMNQTVADIGDLVSLENQRQWKAGSDEAKDWLAALLVRRDILEACEAELQAMVPERERHWTGCRP